MTHGQGDTGQEAIERGQLRQKLRADFRGHGKGPGQDSAEAAGEGIPVLSVHALIGIGHAVEDEPIDARGISPPGQKVHLVAVQSRSEGAHGDEGLGRSPAPIRHVSRRCREFEKVEAAPGEQALAFGHVRKGIGIQVVAKAPMGLKPELEVAGGRPLGEAGDEFLLEEQLAHFLVVFSDPFSLSGLGQSVKRAAHSPEYIDHFGVFGFSAPAEERWEIGRHVVTGMPLERIGKIGRKGQLAHQFEAVDEDPTNGLATGGLQGRRAVSLEEGIGAAP